MEKRSKALSVDDENIDHQTYVYYDLDLTYNYPWSSTTHCSKIYFN